MFLKRPDPKDIFQSYNSDKQYFGFSGGCRISYIDQCEGGSNLRVEIQIGKNSDYYSGHFLLNEKSFWNYSIPKRFMFPIILEEETRGTIILT